jgi:acetyl esterase/lipase
MSNNALHPTVLEQLDPEYIKFHNEHLLNYKSPDYSSWDPSIRFHESPIALAHLPAVDVKSTRDIPLEDKRFFLRVYFSATKQPDEKRPVLVWFHGGMCSRAGSFSVIK